MMLNIYGMFYNGFVPLRLAMELSDLLLQTCRLEVAPLWKLPL